MEPLLCPLHFTQETWKYYFNKVLWKMTLYVLNSKQVFLLSDEKRMAGGIMNRKREKKEEILLQENVH